MKHAMFWFLLPSAFHDLHSLERLECENNPNLTFIHPRAFRDNLEQVFIAAGFGESY
jgi:hypothetical protein